MYVCSSCLVSASVEAPSPEAREPPPYGGAPPAEQRLSRRSAAHVHAAIENAAGHTHMYTCKKLCTTHYCCYVEYRYKLQAYTQRPAACGTHVHVHIQEPIPRTAVCVEYRLQA